MMPAKRMNDQIRRAKECPNDECARRTELGTAKARTWLCVRPNIRPWSFVIPSSFVLQASSFGRRKSMVEQLFHCFAFIGEPQNV